MNAFVITFKPATENPARGWPLEELQALVRRRLSGESVVEPWRFHNKKDVITGDRVFLLLQGKTGPAVIGYGKVANAPGSGKTGRRIPIEFEALVDPLHEVLADETDILAIEGAHRIWRTQSSGVRLTERVARSLESLVVGAAPKPKTATQEKAFATSTIVGTLPFEIGKIYQRQPDIHGKFSGQEQGGISTPEKSPFIFLFTGTTGDRYGYKDAWSSHGVFLFTGEGQVGDMTFIKGNKAIRDHSGNGKDLLLFEALGKGRGVRFQGTFACASWEDRTGPDRMGNARRIIVFHLVPTEADSQQEMEQPYASLDQLRVQAYLAARDVAEHSSREARQSYYKRSLSVRAYVLARAAGICEACKAPSPFRRHDGSHYLEPHHTRRVSDGGPDHPRWVGAICPNCHREIHHGVHGCDLNSELENYLKDIELERE